MKIRISPYTRNLMVIGSLSLAATVVLSAPLFNITPTVRAPAKLLQGKAAIAIYQIINNTPSATNALVKLPTGVSQLAETGFCLSPLNVPSGGSCLLKLRISGPVNARNIAPMICVNPVKKAYCSTPKDGDQLSVNVVSEPDSSMPHLSVPATTELIAGATTSITVSNLSSTTSANDITIVVPPDFANDITTIDNSQCLTLAPGAHCQLQIRTKSNAVFDDDPETATIQGANTYPATSDMHIPTFIQTTPVFFTTPGTQQLTLTNHSANYTLHFVQVYLDGAAIFGVTPITPTIPSACANLGPGQQCHIPFTATAQAHGNSTINLIYTIAGITLTSSDTIGVANTTITINHGNEIELDDNTLNTPITLHNTGAFTWQNPHIQLASLANVTLNTTHCTNNLAPNGQCTLTFTTTGATLGDNALLTASGSNIINTQTNVEIKGGVSIEPGVGMAYQHLQYKAVVVHNITATSADTAKVTAVTVSGLDNLVHWCQAGDNSCAYQSTCTLNTTIPQHGSCILWFRAVDSNQNLGATSGQITVTAEEQSPTRIVTKHFNTTYHQVLYVGGNFVTAGGNTMNYIAQWDGTSWVPLSSNAPTTGVNANVYALATYKGDLYLGGTFTAAGANAANRIARWDGLFMTPLEASGENGVNNTVWSLLSFAGNLVVGGQFTNAGGITTADRIVAWDGSGWSAFATGFNNPVFTLLDNNNTLVAGGQFTNADGNPAADRIATWSGTAWLPLGTGMNNRVRALARWNNELIAGGQFTTASGTTANRIARWNGSSWAPFTLGANNGVNSTVWALATDDNALVVGGQFTNAGAITTADRIALWNGTAWSALTALNNRVYALVTHNGLLYAGGQFTNAGGITTADRIALWNGTSWVTMGSGTNGTVRALLIVPFLNIAPI